jgi:endonuclease/exonuclease/phosphatase family metal-dependent hydrolase
MSFDHVFVREFRASPDVESCGVVKDNHGASDHSPVWAILGAPVAAQEGEPAEP